MDIVTKVEGANIIATIGGEIDGKSAPRVQAELLAALEGGSHLLLDMQAVTFLSSAGLRMLLLLYRQIAAKDGKVVLVGVSEEIQDTMAMTGFSKFFIITESKEAGLAALAQGS